MGDHTKIVLPCRNEGEWLRATIDSILETTSYPSFEILVLANGDERTDFTFLDKSVYKGCVALRRFPEPLGVGKCINEAVDPGDATYYVFLDAHCLVEQSDWLDRTVACLDRHPKASMIQPEVTQFVYKGELEPGARPNPRHCRDKCRAFSITWAWPYEDAGSLAYVHAEPLRETAYEAMAGGGMAVFARADTFHRLGKYDDEVSGWYPETMDYCVRAWLLGYPMLVDPTIRVRHRVKTGTEAPSSSDNSLHGVLRTAYKYLSPRRRDLAENLFRKHGLDAEVDRALEKIRAGRWLVERVEHLCARTHDDDWLFAEFDVYEERFGIGG